MQYRRMLCAQEFRSFVFSHSVPEGPFDITVSLPCLSVVEQTHPGVDSYSMFDSYKRISKFSSGISGWHGVGVEHVRKWLLIVLASCWWLFCTWGQVCIWCSVVSVVMTPSAKQRGHHGLTIVSFSVSCRVDRLCAFGSLMVTSLCRNVVRCVGQCLLPVDHPKEAPVR